MKNIFKFFVGLVLILAFADCTTEPYGTAPVIDPTDENACPDGVISFQYEILPLVVSGCAKAGCHDAITAEEDVVLDNYENIMKEVKVGNANKSGLFKYLRASGDELMPPSPDPKFTDEQVKLIGDWIEQGAEKTVCTTGCISENSEFARDIFPLMTTNCIGCHNDNLSSGYVNLKDYDLIKISADNGSLLGSSKHEAGYATMPPGQKMSDCNIAQLQKWIDEGAQNN